MFARFVSLSSTVLLLSACSSGPISHKNTAGFSEEGGASYYADKYHGRTTASGEPFNQNAMTAAHKRLPFGTQVRVTNLDNEKSVIVRVNDRGPFVRGRVIDLSKTAFQRIANTRAGVVDVKVTVMGH
ncbi:septal ring lytic transglycosylase RlpA family protein [Marinomonas sp. TW1]|uniref:septal ring lytic transglycosylase RlpA family protein n=1 Tax=Marinomonas sp. TW1 TaxID=1561203 RepID=UPI0007AFD0A6|nr:septal ring lytic transglycosylase RlpA family protein [Marinomonas sp. TW1]KZN14141.1 lipoprotein [Marinomonas sp. TW1]